MLALSGAVRISMAGDRYPPEPNCAAQMATNDSILNGPNGTIRSGRLLPVTQCSWTISPTHYYDC